MQAMPGRVWVRGVLVFAVVAAAGCSSGPTKPSTPTPTPVVTPTPCTASAPQPMTSFTANPASITDGDTFTLRWAAPCGFVSLAQKGKGPFMILLPSTGSYTLQTGLDGYPTATGNTVYEARNADTATPLDATVTVLAGSSSSGGSTTPTQGNCGDGICGTGETQANCCADCGCPTGKTCQNPPPGTCATLACPPGTACTTGNACRTGGICAADGVTCNETNKTNGTVCSGKCRVCNNGSCSSDDASLCNDNDACTTDSCSGGTCSNTAITPCCGNGVCESGEKCSCGKDCAGERCDDGNACTHDDQCQSNGTCAGTAFAHCPGTPCSNGNRCVTGEVWQADGVTCGGGTNVPAGPPYTVCQGTCGVCNGYGSCMDMSSMCTGDIRCVTCVSGACGCKPYDPTSACGGSGSGAQYCHNCSCY